MSNTNPKIHIHMNSNIDFSHVDPFSISQNLKDKIMNTDSEYILIDFFADWCGPCKTVAEYLKQAQQALSQQNVNFGVLKINVESDFEAIESGISVQSIPHCILVKKDGHNVYFLDHFTGSKPASQIVDFVLQQTSK